MTVQSVLSPIFPLATLRWTPSLASAQAGGPSLGVILHIGGRESVVLGLLIELL
jgi:hypothetical protein